MVTETMIDLSQYCGNDDEFRPWLRTPFSSGEYTYATNGHIMVRVPRIGSVAEATKEKLGAHLAKLFEGFDGFQFRAPPQVTVPDNVETTGTVDCDSCDGRGKDHDCPDCECKCVDCAGSGRQTNTDKISTEFMGCLYRLLYVRQLMALPGVLISADTANADKRESLRFRFDGGDGLLMPLHSKHKTHVEIGKQEAA